MRFPLSIFTLSLFVSAAPPAAAAPLQGGPLVEETVAVLIAPLGGTAGDFVPGVAQLQATMDELRAFYLENSYGRFTFTTTLVHQVQTLSNLTPDCSGQIGANLAHARDIIDAAVAQAVVEGVDLSGFDHVAVWSPFGYGQCFFDGYHPGEKVFDLGPFGSVELERSIMHSNDPGLGSVAHELGHSLEIGGGNAGLGHAQFLDCAGCGTGTFPEDMPPGAETIVPYGDTFSVMGDMLRADSGSADDGIDDIEPAFHMNAAQKDVLGWFEGDEIVQVPGDGVWQILATESDLPGTKALKIRRENGEWLYVECRKPIGFDTDISIGGLRTVTQGALLHLYDVSDTVTYLIDASPGISNAGCAPWCSTDLTPTLEVGAAPLVDPLGGYSLEVLGEDALSITVRVSGYTPPPLEPNLQGIPLSLAENVLFVWSNPAPVDAITLDVDGFEIANLPGNASQFFYTHPPGGTRSFTLNLWENGVVVATDTVVLDLPCDCRLADFTGSKFVAGYYVIDLADLGEFAIHYGAQDPRADMNCDGVVNLVDVGEFVTVYQAGSCFVTP